MTGLGRRHCHGNRLGVAQFTDQNNIRVFTHCGADAVGKAGDVGTEFSLNDLTLFAWMDKLDRVFETDDIERAC